MKKNGARALAVAAVLLGLLSLGWKLAGLRGADVGRSEFTEDYVAARAAIHGGNGYGDTQLLVDRYLPGIDYERAPVVLRDPHTPTQVVLTAPLTAIPFRAARALWM